MTKRNLFLFLIISFFIFSCSTKKQQPNIVFILVDDLGWADVKCNFPESFYDTPNIDKMAEKGVRFTNAYAANPVCSPTRAALMTGKHPNRVNITDWIPGDDPKKRLLLGPQDSNELALKETTIAEKLKENGYKTCFIGKWHLGDEGYFPENQGFDMDEYLTDRLTTEGINFITQNRDNPFFLYLAFYTVHTPIQASKKYIEKYEAKRKGLNIDKVPHKKEGDGWTKLLQENAAFASMVASMDENVGRVLQTLKENGLDKNTWVIFTSDNGGLSTLYRKNAPTSNGPLRAGKGWCYEGGIRVPLIIEGPGVVNPGRTTDQPAISMDYFTTILSIADIEHKNNDGVNLLPLLTENRQLNRDELFWHYPHYHGSAWTPGSALRKGDWKLVVFYEDNRTELYNLANDPGETKNIVSEYPDKVAELKKILDKKLADSGAKFPVANPDYIPKD